MHSLAMAWPVVTISEELQYKTNSLYLRAQHLDLYSMHGLLGERRDIHPGQTDDFHFRSVYARRPAALSDCSSKASRFAIPSWSTCPGPQSKPAHPIFLSSQYSSCIWARNWRRAWHIPAARTLGLCRMGSIQAHPPFRCQLDILCCFARELHRSFSSITSAPPPNPFLPGKFISHPLRGMATQKSVTRPL